MFQELNVVQKGSWELKCCAEFQCPSKSSTELVQALCTPGQGTLWQPLGPKAYANHQDLCAGRCWEKATQFHNNLNYSQSMKISGKAYFILHICVMTGSRLAHADRSWMFALWSIRLHSAQSEDYMYFWHIYIYVI